MEIIFFILMIAYFLGFSVTVMHTLSSAKKLQPGNKRIMFLAIMAALVWPVINIEDDYKE